MATNEIRRKRKVLSAGEEEYFRKANQVAVERLAQRKQSEKPRLSPITGEVMVEEVIDGVVVDRCPSSNGIWLDAGELEQLIEAAKKLSDANKPTWFERFVKGVPQEEK